MAYRPFVPHLRTFNLEAFTLTGGQAVIAERPCVELWFQYGDGKTTERLWLDPSRDYLILRSLTSEREKTLQQIDVRYRADPTAGWVPEWWKMFEQNRANETAQEVRVGTLTQYEINARISPRELKISFPPGTKVVDEVNRRDYIVKLTGGEREILGKELGLSYEELLHSETGEPLGETRRWSRWLLWSAGVSGSLALAIAGLLWWRRKRQVARV
jgi:hypothetical protein